MKSEFSTFDIVRGFGIPRERLKDWMNAGFISPTVPAEGQGTKALFTFRDICILGLFMELINRGFDRKTASAIANSFGYLGAEWGEPHHIMIRVADRAQDGAKNPVHSTDMEPSEIRSGNFFIALKNGDLAEYDEDQNKFRWITQGRINDDYDVLIIVNFRKIFNRVLSKFRDM